MRRKIKAVTPKSVWKFLITSGRFISKLKLVLILKLANSKISFLNYCVKKQVKKVVWLDTTEPINIFRDSLTVNAFEPNYGNQSSFTVERPKINFYKFENAIVHAESSHIILHDLIVMERLLHIPVEHCDYSTGFIKGHDSKFAVYTSNYETVEVDKAFFLGGNGSWNYYHWTLEIVAKLKYFLVSDIAKKEIKIILPDHAKNIESFSIMLEIILNNAYEFVYISRCQVVNVKELYTITTPSNVVFNTSRGKSFEKNYLFYDKESIDFIRESILSSAQYKTFVENIEEIKIFKKVYLARNDNAGRSYNQAEVLDLVVKQGFVPVYLEELSFLEQVHLFQNADVVIGASGAAWTNIVYNKPNSQGISWLGENIKSFSCYSTLAHYHDCNLRFFTCKVDDIDFFHSSYIVDLHTLSKKILECY